MRNFEALRDRLVTSRQLARPAEVPEAAPEPAAA
jgi:hypothetical protein